MEKQLVWDDPDDRFRIVVAEDRLSATLMFLRPGLNASVGSQVIWALTQLGIRHGLKMAALEAVLGAPRVLIPFPIAHGTPPEAGKPGSWETLLSPEGGLIPEPKKDGSVDFRRVRRFREVEPGQPLSRHLPPGPGAPGVDCFGELVLPPKPKDPPWHLGPGTCFAPENSELVVSAIRGVLVRRDGTLAVEDHLEVMGSVDYETGDINVSVPVLINGDVKPGFLVRSNRNVTVRGCVQSGRVEAGGDLAVRGGILGDPPSEIRVGGNIKAAHLHNACVDCEGSVEIRRSTIACVVSCGGSLQAGEKLIGSHVMAEGEVVTGTIGSRLGAHSRVLVGLPATLRGLLFPLNVRRLELQRMLSEIDLEKKELQRAAALEGAAASRDAVQTAVSADAIDTGALRNLMERQEAVQNELSALDSREAELFRGAPPLPRGGAQIRTLRSVLPGTILGVGTERAKVLNRFDGARCLGEAEARRGRLNVLAVGGEPFQELILKWAQRAGLWSLRLLGPDEAWVRAFRADPPQFLFLEGGNGRSTSGWKILEELAAAPGCSETLLLVFGNGQRPEETERTPFPRMIWIPEPVNASTLGRVGQSIGLTVA